LRFFAAAMAAVGAGAMTVPAEGTLGDAIDSVEASVDAERRERWHDVAAKCSYLVDGIATTDRATPLEGVELIDVMPPFAGG
jgi:sulfur-carrier protein